MMLDHGMKGGGAGGKLVGKTGEQRGCSSRLVLSKNSFHHSPFPSEDQGALVWCCSSPGGGGPALCSARMKPDGPKTFQLCSRFQLKLLIFLFIQALHGETDSNKQTKNPLVIGVY